MSPIVYLYEADIRKVYSLPKSIAYGYGVSMDNNSVFHVFTDHWKKIPFSSQVNAVFFFQNESLLNDDAVLEKCSDNTVAIFFEIENNLLKAMAFFINARKVVHCDVKYIPEKTELYSRSKGLLETSALENKRIAIIGLGSGGSPIAVELAKAGIGKFALIDFDRIELPNIARHVCGINDLGRYKTLAVKDLILQKNPHAIVETFEIDVNQFPDVTREALCDCDLIICASDNDQSRFLINEIALKYNTTAIFGRAITRAVGGDVLRVRPFKGPCYNCLYSQDLRNTEEEISQRDRQARKFLPDYTSEENLNAIVQVGLASDIAPITNFMVKLSLVELSRGFNSGISSLEEDLVADFYIWANRREYVYETWNKLEFNFNKPTVLRWYGAKIERDPNCLVCGLY